MSHTVIPHDLQTYLVSSASREDVEHIVDLSNDDKPECSCEYGLEFKPEREARTCRHIIAAIAFKNGHRLERKDGGSPFALFHCKTTDQ